MTNVITLLVDDNVIQASTRGQILERVGQHVIVAADAFEAVALLEDANFAAQIGLVITDHLMPGMNGPELVGQLRSTLPTLPIVVLSGLPDIEEEYEGLGVIVRSKPFAPRELIALSSRLLSAPVARTA